MRVWEAKFNFLVIFLKILTSKTLTEINAIMSPFVHYLIYHIYSNNYNHGEF